MMFAFGGEVTGAVKFAFGGEVTGAVKFAFGGEVLLGYSQSVILSGA